MLSEEIRAILASSQPDGWVLEPEAKRLMGLVGLNVPRFVWAKRVDDALEAAQEIGYPVVAKIVSPRALHKSDVDGVVVGIEDGARLREEFRRFSGFPEFAGVLVEEMVEGVELIVGAKIDHQFGPVVLVGAGGTGVEIYRDTAVRMAPLTAGDVEAMVRSLKARPLLEGYRGSEPVDREKLISTLVSFSELVMDLAGAIESIDLNPVMCSPRSCVVADARIVLKGA